MQHEVWARLTSSFPSEALAWIVAEIEPGAARARVEPAWSPSAVKARLDAVLGREGWSYALSAAGSAGVVCALSVGSTTRSAAASSVEGVALEQLADLAFARCARQFGLAPAVEALHESYWVDYDAEAGEPLFEPEPVPATGAAQPVGASAAVAAEPVAGDEADEAEPDREPSSEALAMIERLIDRLKAEGLGKEAARLVATYHGDTAEQARELYSRLRALLKQGSGG